jgi:hypothetical protein
LRHSSQVNFDLRQQRGDFAVGGPVEVFAEDEAVLRIAAIDLVEELPVPLAAIEQRRRGVPHDDVVHVAEAQPRFVA